MKKEKNKNILIISLILLVFSLGVFYKTIFNGELFVWYNDQFFQHNVFYQEWYRIIRESIANKTLAVYSWNTFLGTDYLATKLMYCVGDFLITPYFIIHVFLNHFLEIGDINYDFLYAITTAITIVLSGINMSLYLDIFGVKKRWLNITLSIVYALGGFACIFSGSYMFHRFYSLLPLLFFFTEEYLKEGRRTGFILVVALLFMQSYELMFSTCFFMVLYFIVSLKLKTDLNIKEILKKSMKLILSFLIGIMLCGVVLVPLVVYLKSNPRVGGYEYDGLLWSFKVILGFITNNVLPAFNLRSNSPAYLFNTNTHFGKEYGLFVTMLLVVAFVVLWEKGNRKEKKVLFISEIIILLCLFIKPINSIIHGFSVATFRWSFLLEFFHLMMMGYVLEKYKCNILHTKKLILLNVIYLLLYLIFVLVYEIDIKEYMLSFVLGIGCFAFVYVYDLFYAKKWYRALTVFACVNVMIFYIATVYQEYGIYGKGGTSFNTDYLEYGIYTEEEPMSRYYFDSDQLWPYNWLNLNNPVKDNYMGVSTYDSTYESVLSDFLTRNEFDSWMIDIEDYDLLNMLGVKYYVLSEDTEILDSMDYELVDSYDNFKVYKDNNSNHIAYTVNSFVKESEAESVDWGNELIIKDEDYEKVFSITTGEKVQLNVVEYNRQYIKGTIDVTSDSVLFVATPYSDGWNIVDQDGRKMETINVNEGFLGVLIDENVKELNFYYGTPGLKAGLIMSFAGLMGFAYTAIMEKKKKNA